MHINLYMKSKHMLSALYEEPNDWTWPSGDLEIYSIADTSL